MNVVAPADYAAMAVLLVAAFVACIFQTLRICREFSGKREGALELLLDLGILLHLLALCLVFRCFEEGAWLLVLAFGIALPATALVWVNLLPCALCVACACVARKPRKLLTLIPLVATLPPLASLYGRAWVLVCAFDLVFFTLRLVGPYLNGRRWGGQGVGGASPSEVLNLLPHGVLCASARGRVMLMNTAMREILASFGLKTDLSDARALFAALSPEHPGAQRGVRLDDGRSFLITIDDSYLAARKWRFAIAYDVTEEDRLNQELGKANADLRVQNQELARLLRNILLSASREANLEMRGAVHDIVGQRLSILHRHLEDGDLDDRTIAEMRPLIADLLEDLRPISKVPAQAELSTLVAAFGSAGVRVESSGRLSEDEGTARLQVRIVREALTNALRHGRARTVWVELGEGSAKGLDSAATASACASVEVVNDGVPAPDDIIEGNGLSGLRRAVEDAGGVLVLQGAPRFRVYAEVPLRDLSDGGSAQGLSAASHE